MDDDATHPGPLPPLAGPRTLLVPLRLEHAEPLRAIRRHPEVHRWWRDLEDDFPLGDDSESVRFAVCLTQPSGQLDPSPRGMIQYWEEPEPDYRQAGIDLFLDPLIHGRGIGREVVSVLARYLVDVRGHHRLSIDPAADNTRAIACYGAVGFRPVGLMRRYERGPDGAFHDGLLMDALPEDLAAPAPGTSPT
jgi:aminoglycoside 6'-N-acetyltransferase